ncbi:hypothetical protein OVA24_02370 [Luteolibacter sp. SL250]|uniref:hypothetical protein n=1 Tax=Luteolibacter sp. SL250 TaxID=2995170 RepID=UPI00226E03F1|nr:hypothetical protein [Luteolibacter sp. SL250]WAC20224.1 hypothetical protein OVA24_02370 [Luteolibacter sp. SL250]
MKKSGSYLTRAVLAVVGSSAALSLLPRAHAQPSTAFIFENFDNNPTGRVFPNISTISTTATFSGGYGLSGRYTSLGTAYNDAFLIQDGGLQFGALASAGGKKLRASGFNSGATATAIMIDGGRAVGDTSFDYYHRFYCSYLVNFTSISTLAAARAEIRIGGNTAGSAFEMHADGPASPASTTLAQPRLGYQVNNYTSSPSPATQGLAANTTYLMVGRFTQVGNSIGGASGSFNYTSGSNSLVLPTTATAFPGGLEVGHLIKGAPGSGIPDNAIVTGLVTTTDGSVTTRTVLINQNTTAESMNTSVDPPVAGPAPLTSATIVLDRTYTSPARTTAGSNTLTNLPSGNALAVGHLVTHANLPAGTLVTGKPTATTATVSNNATVTASSDITITLRNISPVRGTFNTSSNTMTVDRIPDVLEGINVIPAIRVEQLVEGTGIDPGTVVTAVDTSTKTITLSKPTLGSGSGAAVRFYSRFAKADMWALTEAQYANFISAGGLDSVLNNATIGSAANQVTVKISGTQSVGSWEFNQGKRFEVVAHGTSGSPQTFYLDEIRYGWNLQAVTRNTPYLTPPPSQPNTAGDDMSKNFVEVNDDGFGWKSGWYELEETGTSGAFVSSQPGVELTPGSGRYLQIFHRTEVGADQGTRRRPDPAVVDMSQPYTVKFDYKTIDGSGTVNSFSDRIQIGADGPAGAGSNLGPNPGESTNLTWMVGVVGGNDGTNRVFNSDLPEGGTNKTINIGDQPYWHFFDFDPANFIGTSSSPNYYVPKNMQSSGVPFYQLQTDTYSFQIEVNPLTFTYKATVTNRRTGETGSVANLRFRRQMPAHTLFWGVSKPANETRVVGLDNLRVSQGVPYVDPFPSWVSSFPGVPSGLTGRNVDANGDGRLNFLDFALDGNPMSGVRSSKEIHAISNVGGTNYYTLTIPVRTGATFSATTGPSISTQVDGITYRIQGSYDLANWTTGPDVVPLASPLTTTPALSSGWEYKSFRLSTSTTAQPKAFIRAVVDNAVSP